MLPLKVLIPATDRLDILALLVMAAPVLIDRLDPITTVPLNVKSIVPAAPIATAPVPNAEALAALIEPAEMVVVPL